MAMLAEPRRKQKWTLNPRGKHWSEDSNKYGQRMLEKMGWTTGKGLGINEQGMTEHVRVSLKNDTTGVGFKMEDLDKAWTEYQEGFNDLLQELQKCQNSGSDDVMEIQCDTLNKKSLEMKSKQSRVRVHYQKFARGKDVNRYSSKDLANIFGQKELDVNNKDKEDARLKVEEAYQNEPIGTQDTTSGVVTINSGNMTDYFQKMGGTYCKSFENNKDTKPDDSDCEITYAGFGFASAQNEESAEMTNLKTSTCSYGFENPCLDLGSTEEVISVNETVKASKKRKKDSSLHSEPNLNNQVKKLKQDVPSNHINGFENAGLNLDSGPRDAYNGKEFEVCRAEFGLTNSALDITDEVKETKRVTFNDHVEYSDDSMKKKKGKATLDKFEVENKKQKRKRKQQSSHNTSVSSGFINEALDVYEVAEEINDNEVNEQKSKKTKKRKESRRSNLETILEAPDEDKEIHEEPANATDIILTQNSAAGSNTDVVLDEHISGKKHKKKKKKGNAKEETNEDNIGAQVSINETQDQNDQNGIKGGTQIEYVKEQKKEKKRKKKEKNLSHDVNLIGASQEHTISDEQNTKILDTNVDTVEEQPIERHDKFRISLKKEKKKKKKKKEIHSFVVSTDENLDSEIQGVVSEEKITSELPAETQESKTEITEDVSAKETKKKKKLKKCIVEEVLENSNKEEVSDKENTKINKEGLQSKKPKKSKESKKKKSPESDEYTGETEQPQQEQSDIQNYSQNAMDSESTPSKKNDDKNEISKFISSPWNEKARISKKLLKSLFHRNIISNFPGSNIYDIKGYGVDV